MLSQRKAGEVAWRGESCTLYCTLRKVELTDGSDAESNLDTHDIAFDVGQSSSAESTFRVILVSGNQEWASQKQRVERLKVLQGGRLLAVIFLINADEAATAFARVQCESVFSPRRSWIILATARTENEHSATVFCKLADMGAWPQICRPQPE